MNQLNEAELMKAVHHAALVGGTPIDQVPDIPDGEPFSQEWKAFKREVCRLVREGEKGRFALLKGNQLVNVWDTLSDAQQAGRLQFGADPFLIQEIQLYLKPMRWGYHRPCPK